MLVYKRTRNNNIEYVALKGDSLTPEVLTDGIASVSPIVAHYVNQLNGYCPTWDEINNLVAFGDIRGKKTHAGFSSAEELLMEAVYTEELQLVLAIYESTHPEN